MATNEIKVSYSVGGNDVTLTPQTVANYLSRGNSRPTEQDIVMFISLCKFNKLNPFLNEAYLVKYGSQPAQMITSKEAYFKRAEDNPNFKGIRSGIIVMRQNEIQEVEGCFQAPGDLLLGGWAEVYRADRDYPVVAKVNLSEYDKKQSIWSEKKSTMIAKIAKVQALREAFPSQLGAMYTAEETSGYAEVSEVETETESKKQAESALAKAKKAMSKAVKKKEVKPQDNEPSEPSPAPEPADTDTPTEQPEAVTPEEIEVAPVAV